MEVKVKQYLNALLPSTVYQFIRSVVRYKRLFRNYLYDNNHYFKYSMDLSNSDEKKLISFIVMDTHVIEKGLTMPEMREGFGESRMWRLLRHIEKYHSLYSASETQFRHALMVVNEYFKVN